MPVLKSVREESNQKAESDVGSWSKNLKAEWATSHDWLLLQLKTFGVRGASYQPAFMSNGWTISPTFYSPIYRMDKGNENVGLV